MRREKFAWMSRSSIQASVIAMSGALEMSKGSAIAGPLHFPE